MNKEQLKTQIATDRQRIPYTRDESITEERVGKRTYKPIEEVVIIMWTSGQMEVYRRNSEELLEIFISQHEYIDTVYEAQMKE